MTLDCVACTLSADLMGSGSSQTVTETMKIKDLLFQASGMCHRSRRVHHLGV